MAIQLVADMGINGVIFGDAYTSKDYTFSDNDGMPHWNGREYYVFCFDAIVGGSVMDGNNHWLLRRLLSICREKTVMKM